MSMLISRYGAWRAWMLAWVLVVLTGLPGGAARAASAPSPDWWAAIRNDDVSAVEGMLLRHTDPAAFNYLGNPALIQAAREQSWRVFDYLGKTPGIAVDQANAQDETALMYLCILGQTQRAVALIREGAQVNRLGWTPLHYAASKARIETARMLIDQGAIINAPGPDGTTPLMMAAFSGSEDMVRLLMAHGADPTMFNSARETAADWARKGNSRSLAAKLDDAAARVARDRRAPAGAKATSGGAPDAAESQPSTTNPEAPTGNADDAGSFSRYFDPDRTREDPVGH